MTFLVPMASLGRVSANLEDSAAATNVSGNISATVNFGPQSETRRIMIIAVGSLSTTPAGGATLNSLNISGAVGGINILYNDETYASFTGTVTTIAVALVPSGTSGTVSIAYGFSGSLSVSTRRFIVYSIDGISSNSPVATVARNSTISIPAGGACIGGAVGTVSNMTWTGLNKDLQVGQLSSAIRQAEEEIAGLSVSVSPASAGALTIWAAG